MDEKMEIRLVNPTEDGFLQRIDWNKAELEENVRSIVAAYQGLVYTEDTVSDAKNDRAALRKLLNEIEDRRKLVKKKCMEPYEVFESDLKDVTALIKEQISIIDGQVKEYENSVKEEKKARLQDVYAEEIGELAEVLPFERVFEAQYLNVSFKESKAATEIQEKVQRVKGDLAAIDALDSKYKLNAKDFLNCPLLKDGVFRVDALGTEPVEYTIETGIFDPIIERYVDGSSERQFQFQFGSREFYSMDRLQNIDNSTFYEELAEWVEEQSLIGNLPELPEGMSAEEIEVLSPGYIYDGAMKNARYQISLRLLYFKEA